MAIQESQLGQLVQGRELPFEAEGAAARRATLWGDAWRRLLKNKLGSQTMMELLKATIVEEVQSQHKGRESTDTSALSAAAFASNAGYLVIEKDCPAVGFGPGAISDLGADEHSDRQ